MDISNQLIANNLLVDQRWIGYGDTTTLSHKSLTGLSTWFIFKLNGL